ncbi:hypothetical protein SKAU_G00060150 [Synaphobranchus kaupii]|uniref:Uncharacterized protein n=1 Tax=Synaphobranchus kaupii TaxID=118154 RepID=A0A9Q1JAN5_SYNKA|nr:hypothetical protein SKAU_G00060150 [Synaphobranchus kaupii]
MSIANQDEDPWTLGDCVSDPQPQTDGNSTKASSKRKHCAPPATSSAEASAPGKSVRSQSHGVIPQQTEDPILTALSYIQTSLLNMDARILNLENSPSSTRFIVNEPGIGTSSAATYNANPAPSNLAIEPQRNMGTAIPAAPVGVPFFPPAAAISAHLRAQILAGVVQMNGQVDGQSTWMNPTTPQLAPVSVGHHITLGPLDMRSCGVDEFPDEVQSMDVR